MIAKSIGAEIKDVDEREGIVQHYWSAFGNVDSDGDIIERGAYARTIAERGPKGQDRVKFLWQHDQSEPIGRPLEILEDARGLLATTKIIPTRRGKDALILYVNGVISEHSVGIDVLERSQSDKRRITEVELWEGSAVTWGANSATPTVEVKSRIQKALRCDLSDETSRCLEKALKAPNPAAVLSRDLPLASASMKLTRAALDLAAQAQAQTEQWRKHADILENILKTR